MVSLVDFEIKIEEISIKNNNLESEQESFDISPEISRDLRFLNDDQSIGQTRLNFSLINSDENIFPIDLRIILVGTFVLEKISEEDRESFLKYQAVQILFPYLRTMLSNITSSAFMSPILLPVIDVYKLFGDE